MELKTLEISFVAQSDVKDDMREKIIEDEKFLNGTNTIKDIIKNGKDLMIEYDPSILLKSVYIDMCEKIRSVSYHFNTHKYPDNRISYKFKFEDDNFYLAHVAIADPKIKIYYYEQGDTILMKTHFIYYIREIINHYVRKIINYYDYTHPHLINDTIDYNGVTKNEITVHKNDLVAAIKNCLQKRLYEHASSAIHIFDGGYDEDLKTMMELKSTVNHTRFKD